jgi:hypothetical protein
VKIMVYIVKKGRMYKKNAYENQIPYMIIDLIRDFMENTGYKGSIILPPGPYNTKITTHIERSLELIEKYGVNKNIKRIIIDNEKLSVRLLHTLTNQPLDINTDLKKVFKLYLKKYYKMDKIS